MLQAATAHHSCRLHLALLASAVLHLVVNHFGHSILPKKLSGVGIKRDKSASLTLMANLQDTAGSVAFANDNKTLFYVTKDKLDRPFKVGTNLPRQIGYVGDHPHIVLAQLCLCAVLL